MLASKSALSHGPPPSSVTSEPLDGAERRPQPPVSIVLRFKSARSNRKANKRAEPANHAKGERSQSPRERVGSFAAPLEACDRPEVGTRHRHRKKETAPATRAMPSVSTESPDGATGRASFIRGESVMAVVVWRFARGESVMAAGGGGSGAIIFL